MSNQIGYVLVIASANYKQPIFSVLRQEDIAYQDPLSENENFLEYIKKIMPESVIMMLLSLIWVRSVIRMQTL